MAYQWNLKKCFDDFPTRVVTQVIILINGSTGLSPQFIKVEVNHAQTLFEYYAGP